MKFVHRNVTVINDDGNFQEHLAVVMLTRPG